MAPWFEPKGGDQLLGGEEVNPEPGVSYKSGVIPKNPYKIAEYKWKFHPRKSVELH